jgi:hypothetical protein
MQVSIYNVQIILSRFNCEVEYPETVCRSFGEPQGGYITQRHTTQDANLPIFQTRLDAMIHIPSIIYAKEKFQPHSIVFDLI